MIFRKRYHLAMMNKDEFTKKIYEPYQEAWLLVRKLYGMDSDTSELEWRNWINQIDKFRDSHSDNEFIGPLYRMLLDAGDVIGKMNGKT